MWSRPALRDARAILTAPARLKSARARAGPGSGTSGSALAAAFGGRSEYRAATRAYSSGVEGLASKE